MAAADPLNQLAARLADCLRDVGQGLVVVVTGAGVSHASGIPTFRGTDPDAIWKRDVTELGTYAYFLEDPVGSWCWYMERFNSFESARPNPAHRALVELEHWQEQRGGELLVITQNIDTLHEQAGSQNLIKVHGSSDRVRCPRVGCSYGTPAGSLPRDDFDLAALQISPRPENLPVCPECGTVLRQHVLWFDEYYGEHLDYQFERAMSEARRMSLLLCVGTSFSVGITDLLLQVAAARRVPMISIDPAGDVHRSPHPSLQLLPAAAEELLPLTCSLLGSDAGARS